MVAPEHYYEEVAMDAVVRSIDVGYGSVKYVTATQEDQIRCAHFPSAAYATDEGASAIDPMGARRKTVRIPVDGLFYEVGPDVHLAGGLFCARHMHDAYCATPEYRALARGAMYWMKVERIDLLMLGLPVAVAPLRSAALERAMTGTHDLGRGRSVHVARVKVIAQPRGALFYYGMSHDRMAQLRNEVNLVIDPGSRTFDWVVSRGLQMIQARSHSLNRGMYDVAASVAAAISKVRGLPFQDLERIDVALRDGKRPKVDGQEYDITRHLARARAIAEEAVSEMIAHVGNGGDIDNIILVGGGAYFFKPAIKQAFPKHRIQELREGLFCNVRGFQLAGQELLAIERSRPQPEVSETSAAKE